MDSSSCNVSTTGVLDRRSHLAALLRQLAAEIEAVPTNEPDLAIIETDIQHIRQCLGKSKSPNPKLGSPIRVTKLLPRISSPARKRTVVRAYDFTTDTDKFSLTLREGNGGLKQGFSPVRGTLPIASRSLKTKSHRYSGDLLRSESTELDIMGPERPFLEPDSRQTIHGVHSRLESLVVQLHQRHEEAKNITALAEHMAKTSALEFAELSSSNKKLLRRLDTQSSALRILEARMDILEQQLHELDAGASTTHRQTNLNELARLKRNAQDWRMNYSSIAKQLYYDPASTLHTVTDVSPAKVGSWTTLNELHDDEDDNATQQFDDSDEMASCDNDGQDHGNVL